MIRYGIRTWHRNFPLLRKFGLSFDMQLFPSQAEHAVRLVADNPDILIIFTHARDADVERRREHGALEVGDTPVTPHFRTPP